MQIKKKVYFEFMRIIAVGLVIFNHLPGYTLYMSSEGIKQWLYMFFTMTTRINVPLFLMISGALLLGKEEDFEKVIKKRVFRFILIIFIFETGFVLLNYFLAICKSNQYSFSIKNYIYGIFAGNIEISYWYLYAYLGMLLMLPFMQRIAKKMNKQDFYVLLILQFILSSFIPILNFILNRVSIESIKISDDFSVPLATFRVLFYPLIGYYIDRNINVKTLKKKDILKMIIIAFAGIFVASICTYYEGKISGGYTQNYVQLFDYLITIIVFIIVKYMFTVLWPNLSYGKTASIICIVGSLTFGIYLLDPYFRAIFYETYAQFINKIIPKFVGSIGWCIISMFLCGIVTYILKKVPVLKKII